MGYNSNYVSNKSSLVTFFKLSAQMGLSLNIENYLEKIDKQKTTNSFFSDLGFNYHSGKIGLELSLKNIFNRKQYYTNSYFELTQIEQIYPIRPRSIMIIFSTNF